MKGMNFISWIVLGVIVAAVALIIGIGIYNRQKGKGAACGGCAGCALRESCHKAK